MRGKHLIIDTNFGIPELDYTNSSIYQIKTHNKLLENLDKQIKKRYLIKINEARIEYKTPHNNNNGYLTDNLLCYSHMHLSDELGPDQSYFGPRGEHNSVEIYLKILRAMWNDYIPGNSVLNRRKLKKGLNKTRKILIKSLFNRWKKTDKISRSIAIKGLKIFARSITN